MGFEPTTLCLKGRCSNLLSYGPASLGENFILIYGRNYPAIICYSSQKVNLQHACACIRSAASYIASYGEAEGLSQDDALYRRRTSGTCWTRVGKACTGVVWWVVHLTSYFYTINLQKGTAFIGLYHSSIRLKPWLVAGWAVYE